MDIVTDRKILEQVSDVIEEITTEIKKDIYNMEKYLKKTKNGAGIAAIQLGIKKKIIAIKFDDYTRVYPNPIVMDYSGEQIVHEGCLSFPVLEGDVRRYQ